MFSNEMTELYTAVIEASKIAQEELKRKVLATVKDDVPGGSHHSIGTQADVKSQEHMLTVLRKLCPDAMFLAEENCRGPDVITDETLHVLKEPGSVFILDALDGTAGAYRHRWDWSICGNLMRNWKPVGGVVVAPDVRGGMHVVGERGVGVFTREDDGDLISTSIQPKDVRKSTVLFGVDVHKRPQFMRFANVVANAVETAITAGSCALGVATVVAGRAEAIVQPHQWPWDWTTAATLIPTAGGKVIWYQYRSGQIIQLVEPDLPAYSRVNRTDHGGLGFIAGCHNIVDWLWNQLQENWPKERRTNDSCTY